MPKLTDKVKETRDRKQRKFLKALEKTLGVVTAAARIAKMSPDTHYFWLKTCPDYVEKYNQVKEIAIDFAETSLFKQIENQDTAATIFYLKTQAKSRGYVEQDKVINVNTTLDEISKVSEEELMAIINREV